MDKSYVLVKNEDNKLTNKIKNSFLGSDIGIKSENFISVILLSTFIAAGALLLMYYSWRI